MDDEAAFIETIRLHPDNDIPRLIYADWLEERSDSRAEYLRRTVEISQLEEELNRFFELRRTPSTSNVARKSLVDRSSRLGNQLDELARLRSEIADRHLAIRLLTSSIDAGWRKAVGIKYDFILTLILPGCTGLMVEAIRGFTGLSRAKAKVLTGKLPSRIEVGLMPEESAFAKRLFELGDWPGRRVRIERPSNACEVTLRTSG